ncbi:helix-turn-helix domain-containing protein [Streptococcus equi]|uniref:helix-turn-helix domain-containing protein n=1 Tax=Streptococcus equi TaxID=1336 RepID=UPI0013F63FFE|nr:helix-turn-helix domain-containing protein [Streptococcus equi]
MNDFKAKQVWKYRNEGLGYRKIANLLDLSLTAVKRYCNTNPYLKGYGQAVVAMISDGKQKGHLCKECMKPIVQPKKGRIKQFCSASCRRKNWLKKYPEKANNYFCKLCGMTFTAYGSPKRIYCSRSCARNSRRS